MNYSLILLFFFYFAVTGYARAANFAGQGSTQSDAFQKGLVALKENRIEDALREFTAAERD